MRVISGLPDLEQIRVVRVIERGFLHLKFARLIHFAESLPALRKTVAGRLAEATLISEVDKRCCGAKFSGAPAVSELLA